MQSAEHEGYKIVVAASAADLSQLVNRYVSEGWKPQGGPFKRDGALCQAVVRKQKRAAQYPPGVEFKSSDSGKGGQE